MSVLIAVPAEYHRIMKIPLCICMSHTKPRVMIYFFQICFFVPLPPNLCLLLVFLISVPVSQMLCYLQADINQYTFSWVSHCISFHNLIFSFSWECATLQYLQLLLLPSAVYLLKTMNPNMWSYGHMFLWNIWSYGHMFSWKHKGILSSWWAHDKLRSCVYHYVYARVWLICKSLSLGLCFHIRARRFGSLPC